jgi:hypothetical protein
MKPVPETLLSRPSYDDHRVVLPAIIGTGATGLNWSSDVSTLCQRNWSFLVSVTRGWNKTAGSLMENALPAIHSSMNPNMHLNLSSL